MKRFLLFLTLLIVISGCVQIPVDEPAEPKDEADAVLEPEPTPLAPLPEEPEEEKEDDDGKMSTTTGPATVPKAVTAQQAAQQQQQSQPAQQQQPQYAWTTESLSIEEGETKYIYIKDPVQP